MDRIDGKSAGFILPAFADEFAGGQAGELDAVVGEHGMDAAWNGFDERLEERDGGQGCRTDLTRLRIVRRIRSLGESF